VGYGFGNIVMYPRQRSNARHEGQALRDNEIDNKKEGVNLAWVEGG